MNLAVKYRPKEFEDVCAQSSVVKILEKQIETKSYVNTYLFTGSSGCGKTTIARIFANKINKGQGQPIEIDAASNNGVDNVRLISEDATQRSLDSEYKIFIVDECHSLTNQSWQALLKLIEEPPKYTIFIFCTTELQKVPKTIQNRCQMYHFTKVPDNLIIKRLKYISNNEGIRYTDDALFQITKIAQGSMRQAITYLDKCKDFSNEINLDCVLNTLGDFSYDIYFDLTNSLIDRDQKKMYNIIDNLYNKGNDLKVFLDQYIEFILDVSKFTLFRAYDIIKIPQSYKSQLEYIINLEGNITAYYNKILDKLLDTKLAIKGDSNIRSTIEIMLASLFN